MIWSRTYTLALAQQSCAYCHGLGMKPGRNNAMTPCACVFRAIFRACYARFRQCASKEKYISRVSLEANPGRQRKNIWGMKNEEYIADFCLVSKRFLDAKQYELFKFHFLLGAEWKACCVRIGIDRGTFFHEIYRIQERLGRAFREMTPHALFPLDEYFGGAARGRKRKEMLAIVPDSQPDEEPVGTMLRFPIKEETEADAAGAAAG